MISLVDLKIKDRAARPVRTAMTPAELKAIRAHLGLTQLQLGQWLGFDGGDPGHTVRMWEIGKRSIAGPIAVLLEAFVAGWRPRHVTLLNTVKEDTTNG